LLGTRAQAYPEFISYGYSSCLTCHTNGLGSGPLNDYGRALWSAEIASRAFYSKSKSDEDIANQSGFLGSVEIPYWIRPHIKYRGIQVRTSPGSGTNDGTKFYQMQTDMGLTLQADSAGKYVAVATWGNVVPPAEYSQQHWGLYRVLAKEYYLRLQMAKTWWLYAGLMDKVFGIRGVDHQSYQRTYQGFNVNNDSQNGIGQSQGLILHKVEDTWEVAANYFVGHPGDSENYKQKGFSGFSEFEVGEKKRLGASLSSAKSNLLKKDMFAIHYRQGLSKGSSMMFEYGLIEDQDQTQDKLRGSYNLIEGMALLTRGYNLRAAIERYNRAFKPEEPDVWRWSMGLLMFPLPRLEIRTEFVNGRRFSTQSANDDTWSLQGQIHVSL